MSSMEKFNKLPKVARVYLCTNRNCLFFDEKGSQIPMLQRLLNWRTSADRVSERLVIKKVIEDLPEVYLVRWRHWAEPITLQEFVDLLGYGPVFDEELRAREIREIGECSSLEELEEIVRKLESTLKRVEEIRRKVK